MKKFILLFISWLIVVSVYAQPYRDLSIINTKNIKTTNVDQRKAFSEFLQNHDYSKEITLNEYLMMPKKDRPDLAWRQDFLMTLDPALKYPPTQRLLPVMKQISNMNGSLKDSPGAVTNPWVERGPSNVGGRVRALMWDPNDVNHKKVWAGGVTGGLWYNNDITSTSSSWVSVDDFWDNISISCIAYDPNNTQIFYVGTGEGFTAYGSSSSQGHGIWKTTNGGANWSQLDASTNYYWINDIIVRNNGGTSELYVAAVTKNYLGSDWPGEEGLFLSTNGGTSFANVIPQVSSTNNAIADIEIAANNRLFVGTVVNLYGNGGGQILYSDNGTDWTVAYSNTNVGRVELACAPSDANYVYAIFEHDNIVDNIIVSTDNGVEWTAVSEPVDVDDGIPDTDFSRNQAWYDLILAVDPANPTTVIVGAIDLFITTDGGTAWTHISKWSNNNNLYDLNCSVVHADHHAIVYKPGSSSEVIFGNDGGVAYTNSISTATTSDVIFHRNTNLNITQFYACAIHPTASTNHFLAGAQDNGSHRFSNAGLNATAEVTGGDGAYCFIDQSDPNYQITSYVYNNYYLSTDGGQSFSYSNYLLDDSDNGLFINPADYDNNMNILYSTRDNASIYRVKSVTATPSSDYLSIPALGDYASNICVSPYTTSSSTVFLGTRSGKLFKVTNADNTSASITELTGASFPTGTISCIEIGASENELLVTFKNYGVVSVWYSSDGGTAWISKEGNLPDMPVRWALFNPSDRKEVVLATELGVWATTDITVTSPIWTASNSGLANVRIDMLQYRTSDNEIIAATHGRGLFSSSFSGEVVETGGTLNGFVTDATNGEAISGATVSVAGLSTTTAADGSYSIEDIPVGSLNSDFYADVTSGQAPLTVQFTNTATDGKQIVTASATGYITYVNNQVDIQAGQTLTMDISLSTEITDGEYRIVLNWGASPNDLDSHLKTPEIEGSTYHIYYSNKGSATSAPYAILDHDDTQSYGPETITIYDLFTGTYNYYIYNYSSDGGLTTSGAVVQLYSQLGLAQTFQVPTSGTGEYWHIFNIDGSTGNITVINQIQEAAPGYKDLREVRTKDIVSYSWNFGDGSSSTDANPEHIYLTEGSYNVSLTVSNGTDEAVETKTSYIAVSESVASKLYGYVTNAVNGEPIAGAIVSAGGVSDFTDADGYYYIENVPQGGLNSDFIVTNTVGEAPLTVTFSSLATDGAQIVSAHASNYIEYSNNQVSIIPGDSLQLDISLSPTLSDEIMRIVLNWGAAPSDLDAHLKTPYVEGTIYDVSYSNPGNDTVPPYAKLDHDDRDGFGPETISLYETFPGKYSYYVHKYSTSGTLIESGSEIHIYTTDGLQSISIPTSGTGDYWHVFDLDGVSKSVTIINEIVATAPGAKLKIDKIEKSVISWQWSFGDTNTSTNENPTHTYEAAGTYDVTLTVNNGSTSDTEIKEDYITVSAAQIGGIKGYVTDATTGSAIEGALITIGGLSDVSDTEGYYEIRDVPVGGVNAEFLANHVTGNYPITIQFTDLSVSGTQTVNATADDYIEYVNEQVFITLDNMLTMDISLSPTLSDAEMRIVLNWGASPNDLDSHLKTPEIEGSTYHIYYSDPGSATTAPFVILDHDDTQSYGPETITIYDFYTGTYNYYIYNYSDDGGLTTSSAVVQVYNQAGLLQTIQVPTSGTGEYWHVFDINGDSKQLTIVNQIQETAPGATDENLKNTKIDLMADITSWTWSFGDGATSTAQNPSHIYNSAGVYTVSLSVSDGTNGDTEIKTDFISIYQTDIEGVVGDKEVAMYPNPSNGNFMFEITNATGNTQVEIRNITGQCVFTFSVSETGRVVKQIDITDYPEGMYFVLVKNNNNIKSYKIIVKR